MGDEIEGRKGCVGVVLKGFMLGAWYAVFIYVCILFRLSFVGEAQGTQTGSEPGLSHHERYRIARHQAPDDPVRRYFAYLNRYPNEDHSGPEATPLVCHAEIDVWVQRILNATTIGQCFKCVLFSTRSRSAKARTPP